MTPTLILRFLKFACILASFTGLTAINVVSAEKDKLSVMTYNIMQLPYITKWDQDQRADYLPEAIRSFASFSPLKEQPDVIILNEVFTNYAEGKIRSLGDIYPYESPNIGASCSGADWDTFTGAACSVSPFVTRGGVKIISKYPILRKGGLVYEASNNKTWDYNANKGAVYVKIRKPNGCIYHVFGTHAQADRKRVTDTAETRMKQFTELNNWMKAQKIPSNEAVIIGGDLNVEYKATPKDCLKMVRLLQANFDCTKPAPNLGSFSAAKNWMAKAGAKYYEFPLDYEDTLDYVFPFKGSSHVQPVETSGPHVLQVQSNSEIYWKYLESNWGGSISWHNGYHRDVSDHYPVMTTFTYE